MNRSLCRLSLFVLLALSLALAPAANAQTADGVRIYSGITLVAEVASGAGSAVGEIAVEHLQTDGPFDVVFLDTGVEFTPAGPMETLGLSLSPGGIATLNSTGPWSFELTGDVEGMTDLTVQLLDNGVPQYTSPAIEVHVEEEFEADGLRIRDGITLLVEENMGVVTGEIEAEHGQTTGDLDITFLDDMGGEFTPDMEFDFQFTVADPTIATVTKTGDWTFTVTGVLEGVTTMSILVEHDGHFDYTSQPIEIHVEEEFEADGLRIRDGITLLVEENMGVVTGEIEAEHGQTTGDLDITFLDDMGGEFTPDAEFDFQFTVANTAIATVTKTGPWSFTVTGVEDGITTMTILVEHDGHFDYTSQPIEIHVEEGFEAEGMRIYYDVASLAVEQDMGVLTGALSALPGHTSSTHTITFINDEVGEFTPDSEFVFQFIVADPSIATVTKTGDWEFTVSGLLAGSTTMNVQVEHDGHFDFVSENIPINVGGATGLPNEPTTFALRSVFPNPFGASTSVAFSLANPSRVNVVVYDVRGRAVREILDEERSAGIHTVRWDASELASGTYFVRLSTPDEVATRKILVQR